MSEDGGKVYSNCSEADFVMPSGIITSYLISRLVVRRGFIDTYPPLRFLGQPISSHCYF